jgi:hypothetical protein
MNNAVHYSTDQQDLQQMQETTKHKSETQDEHAININDGGLCATAR